MRSLRRFWPVLVAAAATTAAAELLLSGSAHTELFWHRLPGFDFGFGLAGCAFLVAVAKWLGYRFLYRPEDYYEEESSSE